MGKRFAAVFATLSIAALTAAGASELARSPTADAALGAEVVDAATIDSATTDEDGVPIPVGGSVAQMFAVAFGDQTDACLSRDDVVARLRGQVHAYGGQVVVLEDGLEQSFADQWRREAHLPMVKVTGVVAHLFGDRDAGDWAADVVEFDKAGCAMSRTLVPGDIWTGILEGAVGVEV